MNNKNLDLISIIIPCFNSGKTIKRTIKSIDNQTWVSKEIIVVNDGSNEKDTLNVLQELKKVKVINQKNMGLPSARNNGVKNSMGNYLLFLDADDWLEPNALEYMFKNLLDTKKPAFIFSDIKLEGDANNIVRKKYNFFEQLFLNQLPYCILISRANFNNIGGYDEQMKSGYEDWEFNIRLGKNNIYGRRLELPLFHYSVNKSGMLISKSSKYHLKIWKYIKEKNKDLYAFKELLKLWLMWRKIPSNYPLLIYIFWLFLVNKFPDRFISNVFIFLRNSKWFFVRNKYFKN
tara:strand:- start:474 stop:1343 length:870 start_codon:yes stop_codon:yes gene_type:complete